MGFRRFLASLLCVSKAQADTDSILPITKDFITSSSSISSASTASTRTSNRSQEILDKASGRTMVLQEFISSEETYVNLLEEFDDIYIQSACAPLIFHTLGKLSRQVTFYTALTLEERRTMFNGLQEILSLHRTLVLPKLFAATQVLLTQGDDHDGLRSTHTAFEVCQVICKFADWFKMYSAYSVTCDNATARLTQWTNGINMVRQDKNRVQAYLTKCKVNNNHSQINMTGYLLLPVQRLTRYKMLLEQLEKYTPAPPSGARDYIGEALSRISTILVYVNDYKRDLDARSRLCHWADQISSVGPSPLVQPHRTLIREGPIKFIARGALPQNTSKTLKHRHVDESKRSIGTVNKMCMAILCQDLLVLVDNVANKQKGKLELVDVVRLSAMGNARVEWGNVVVFEAYHNTEQVSYYLRADDQEIAQGWVDAINQSKRS
ncbi:hypothetical protein CNBE1310 [Cryptococcus deneoformans B-3501A]|uniref:hypothetical protein n=1 Tax=Cryptococcus deneoformans (strain B-3501A) TaxID=283643 RepID=UPI000042C129|nr:hypothetical protein CNBE1310 [Cryptococcus neoformans var. neoformans B-3501A]EAL20768.1 hypothetical protein CNBE1310 [Cryptococcus neoformans var. neoformans B-3501A]